MKYVNDFYDYEVIDCGDFEKIERFRDIYLRRPDPQAIWHMKNSKKINVDAVYHRSSKGGGSWEFFKEINTWQIKYDLSAKDKIIFNLKPFSFKHTGVFPEQAVNWKFIYDRVKSKNNLKILNLFAYTGGATIAAALAGANVTHVDASKGIVSWAKENAISSNVSHDKIRWLVDDCRKFINREIRRGSVYDGIILDPPSYGRGSNNEVWKLEDDIYDFLVLISNVVNKENGFVLYNSYTTGLQPAVLKYMLSEVFEKKFSGTVESYEIGVKVSSTGLYLPEGCSGVWYR